MKTIFLAILTLAWVNTAIAETESERMFDDFARSAQAARIEREYEARRQQDIEDQKQALRDVIEEEKLDRWSKKQSRKIGIQLHSLFDNDEEEQEEDY